MKNKEIWKDVAGYEGLYKVSNHGNIRSYIKTKYGKDGLLMSLNEGSKGYLLIKLFNAKSVSKKWSVHRLVALAFVPNPENKPEINHKDGIKNNNYFKNLEWCTPSENLVHAFKFGLKMATKGEKNPCSKVTSKQILKIRSLIGTLTQSEIADRFGISQSAVSLIIHRKLWNHI